MTGKPRNIPESTSPIGAAGPPLKADVGPLSVGDAAGTDAEPAAPPTALRKNGRVWRSSAPRADEAVPTTIRFHPDEAAEIDAWLISLRRVVGRRVDKSEAVRELLRMARLPDSQVRKTLIKRLRGR